MITALSFVLFFLFNSSAMGQNYPVQADTPAAFMNEVLRVYKTRAEDVFRWGIKNKVGSTYEIDIPRYSRCPDQTVIASVSRIKLTDGIRESLSIQKCGLQVHRIEIERRGPKVKEISDLDLIFGLWPEFDDSTNWKIALDKWKLSFIFVPSKTGFLEVQSQHGNHFQLQWRVTNKSSGKFFIKDFSYHFQIFSQGHGGGQFSLTASSVISSEAPKATGYRYLIDQTAVDPTVFSQLYNTWITQNLQQAFKDAFVLWMSDFFPR